MDGLTLLLVALSVSVFMISRVAKRGKSLAIFPAILAAASFMAVLSDSTAESWQIILVCITDVYIFLISIIDPEDDSRWRAAAIRRRS